jgi:hypothetical protein
MVPRRETSSCGASIKKNADLTHVSGRVAPLRQKARIPLKLSRVYLREWQTGPMRLFLVVIAT